MQRLSSGGGVLEWEWMGPDLVHFRCSGHGTAEIAKRIIAEREQGLRTAGKVEELHDWAELTGYDSEARRLLTDNALRNRDRLVRIHILLRSRLVHMGVTVASIPLGGLLQSYPTRAAFERAVADARARRAR